MNEVCTIVHSIYTSLCFLNPHPPVSCHSSPQLTLPEGTQPRWGHTLTCCRMGESRTHVTTFGGGSKIYAGIKDSDIPKLADTTVLEFGEQNTFHCTIYWVVRSLTLSYCVNQFNRSLTDIHLGPTDCGSATCFLLCDIPAATDMQPPLLQCVLTVCQGLTDSVVVSLH